MQLKSPKGNRAEFEIISIEKKTPNYVLHSNSMLSEKDDCIEESH